MRSAQALVALPGRPIRGRVAANRRVDPRGAGHEGVNSVDLDARSVRRGVLHPGRLDAGRVRRRADRSRTRRRMPCRAWSPSSRSRSAVRFSIGLPTDRVELAEEFVTGDGGHGMRGRRRTTRASTRASSPITPRPTRSGSPRAGTTRSNRRSRSSFAAAATTRVQTADPHHGARVPEPVAERQGGAQPRRLSGGRMILGVAAGYLKPEFAALGVDFDERNALTDEAIDVIRGRVDHDRAVRARRQALPLARHDDATATGRAPVPTDLDRRQQPRRDPARGRAGRRMGAVPQPGVGGARRAYAAASTASTSSPDGSISCATHAE